MLHQWELWWLLGALDRNVDTCLVLHRSGSAAAETLTSGPPVKYAFISWRARRPPRSLTRPAES